MHTLWTRFIYDPIYNSLVFIAQNVTFQDVGLAVVTLTIIIRLIIAPLSKKSIVGQYKMRALQPKIDAIKAKGLSREAEAAETFALYKQEKVNPFSGCLYLLVQLPILFALYFVFIHGVDQPEHLYNFLTTENLKNSFLGLIDITQPFLPLAILAGVTQAIQAFLAPHVATSKGIPAGSFEMDKNKTGFQGQFAKSMLFQTRYVLPIVIIFIANTLASAIALYWSVANIFSILQELYIKKKILKH
jgi:YidC/Oxa1 family membrane protein insertase